MVEGIFCASELHIPPWILFPHARRDNNVAIERPYLGFGYINIHMGEPRGVECQNYGRENLEFLQKLFLF